MYWVLVCTVSVVVADGNLDLSNSIYTVELPTNSQIVGQRPSAMAASNQEPHIPFSGATSTVITPIAVTKRRLGKQRKGKTNQTPLGESCIGGPSAWLMVIMVFAVQFVSIFAMLWGTRKARPQVGVKNGKPSGTPQICCLDPREVGVVGAGAVFCAPFLFFWSTCFLLLAIAKLASTCTYRDDKDNLPYRHWYVLLVIVANLCLCAMSYPLMKIMDRYNLNAYGAANACVQLHGVMVKTLHPQPQVAGKIMTEGIIVVTMHITTRSDLHHSSTPGSKLNVITHGSKLDLKFTTVSGNEVLGITYDKACDNVDIIWPALREALGEPICSIRLLSQDGAVLNESALRELLADKTCTAV